MVMQPLNIVCAIGRGGVSQEAAATTVDTHALLTCYLKGQLVLSTTSSSLSNLQRPASCPRTTEM